MTPKDVGDVLEATLGYRIEMRPNGFDLMNDLLVPERARLQRGSGIAGLGNKLVPFGSAQRLTSTRYAHVYCHE